MLPVIRSAWFAGWLLPIALLATRPLCAEEPAAIDFTRDVKPILSRNCFVCHGPDESSREAGLRLDRADSALATLESGATAVVPGKPAASELIARITSTDPNVRMPPAASGHVLTDDQIDRLRQWVAAGGKYDDHWSFRPVTDPQPPPVRNAAWIRNPIDHFVLARLERARIAPSPEASRETLLRRLSLDLLGLPPTPDDLADFLNDNSPDAFERAVDRLLASPQFGERWGRHWLDLAHYADSDGYLGDTLRPYAWLYRDWVIDAINSDLSFDQFTIEQLAGDLLPEATLSQKTATGFLRNTLRNTEAGADLEEYRLKEIVDRVSTVGIGWLGLSLGCAECHSHKFDPISHREFYELFSFFNNADEVDLSAPQPGEAEQYAAQSKIWLEQEKQLSAAILARLGQRGPPAAGTDHSTSSAQRGSPDSAQRGSDSAQRGSPDPAGRGPKVSELVALDPQKLLRALATEAGKRAAEQKDLLAAIQKDADEELQRLCKDYEKHATKKPQPPATKAMTIARRKTERVSYIHLRGDYRSRGEDVRPGTPAVLPPLAVRAETADRLDLARWLVHPANPLTSRVTVNHLWKHLFGRGLVSTADNFGAGGEPPSHPELLDWLARQLMDRGWSRKSMLRLIVTSATYRQTSQGRPELEQRDPLNVLLSRQQRFRLEAESVRDSALAASGLLEFKIGGPGIRPPQPAYVASISRNTEWKVSTGADLYRRGLYILFRRATPYPMLLTFDTPDSTVACVRRERSNSPLQALTLLNDPVFFECAQALGQVLAGGLTRPLEDRIVEGFHRCLGRDPSPAELDRLCQLFERERVRLATNPQAVQAILGKNNTQTNPEVSGQTALEEEQIQRAVWVVTARVLMNLDEFITRE